MMWQSVDEDRCCGSLTSLCCKNIYPRLFYVKAHAKAKLILRVLCMGGIDIRRFSLLCEKVF
jgi:hypothetical protein